MSPPLTPHECPARVSGMAGEDENPNRVRIKTRLNFPPVPANHSTATTMKTNIESNTQRFSRARAGRARLIAGLGLLALLFIAGTPRAGAQNFGEVFADHTRVDSLVLRNGLVFWQADCTGAIPPQILSQPSARGSTSARHLPTSCDASRPYSLTVALDAGNEMFWATWDSRIVRKRASASATAAPSLLTPMEGTVAAGVNHPSITTSSSYVYWTESYNDTYTPAKILGARKSDGRLFLVRDLTALGGGAVKLQAVDDFRLVYLQINGDLVLDRSVFVIGSGSRWERQVIDKNVTGFTVANERIYYALPAPMGAVELRSVPLSNVNSKTWHHFVQGTGSPRVAELAADSANLYWHEIRSHSGPIMRQPLPPTYHVPEALTDNLGDTDPLWLESDGRHVFWMHDRATIRQVAVGAAAVVHDLAATGLEVVQAIQSPANDVPLVQGKATFVRLYGQIVSGGASSLDGWPMALLYGEKDGVALPGSPIEPVRDVGGTRIFDRPADRTTLNEGFLFRLPREWTLRGAITLRGQLNPAGVIRETNLANNSTSVAADFVRKAPVCVIIHPIRTTLGVVGDRYRPSYQPYFDLVEAMLPASELEMHWAGGEPLEEIEPAFGLPPWEMGPYELSKDNDDMICVLWKLWERNTFGDDPDRADDLNARTHRACLFWPFSTQQANGMSIDGDVLIAQLQLGGSGINNPLGGVTFAHELGHNYGRDHVNCPVGVPEDTDPGYPYGCDITPGASSYLGLNPITRTLILPGNAGDLMSYAHLVSKPRWPSDYTWKGVFNDIDLIPAGARLSLVHRESVGSAGVGGTNYSAQSLVMGMIKPGGQAKLINAVQFPDAASATRAADRMKLSGGNRNLYTLIVRDAGGQILASVPVIAFKATEAGGYVLAAIVPANPAATKLELTDNNRPNSSLASLEGGGGAPVVHILSPGANEIIGPMFAPRWTGADPEGRTLRYTIRYSHNNGATWQVLTENTLATELALSTASLPGGSACLIQVLASDGIATGIATSAPFTVASKPPQPEITIETARGRSSGPSPRVCAGEDVLLRGHADDAEDGVLPGSALTWSLNGPVNRTGADREWLLRDLRPGNYTATLAAADHSQMSASIGASFTVAAKFPALTTNTPTLDGYGDDAAYREDRHPVSLRYASGQSAQVRMVFSDGALHVCVSGLAIGKSPAGRVALAFSPNHSRDIHPKPDDVRFTIGSDGLLLGEHGNGSSFVPDFMPTGAVARVSCNLDTWTAEFKIDAAMLGGWNGQTLGLDVAHLDCDFPGDDAHWFAGDNASSNNPVQWADVTLAVDANDPYDSDGDGLPDAWELSAFGTLARDGSGDFDSDGVSDAGEFTSGTDPASAASTFRVTRVERGPGVVRITWPTIAGRTYTVWQAADLRTFIPVRGDMAGTGGEITAEFEATGPCGFFRVEANPNP